MRALLLAMIFAAAYGGSEHQGATDMGRSSYRQSYQVPLSGNVPPNKPSQYNDEFAAQRPATVEDPAFVQLAPKWTTWDHGEALDNVPRINPRLQLMQLVGRGNKVWAGTREALPVPTEGSPVGYMLYVRCMNTDLARNEVADMFYGMMLGEDLADPESLLAGVYGRLSRAADGTITGDTQCAQWLTYDAPDPTAAALLNSGWPAQYLRAEVSSSLTAGVYSTNVTFAASMDGIGYQQLERFSAIAFPFRHVALAQRSVGDLNLSTFFDSIRLFEFDPLFEFDMYARVQQLGSV